MAERNLTIRSFLSLKFVFHWRSSLIEGRLPSKIIFHRRLSFIESCLPSTVIFHQLRLSSIERCLWLKVLFAGVNIFRNLLRIMGEKFPNLLGSGEEFNEIQFHTCCCNLGWGSVNYLEGNFFEGIVSHIEGELNTNYPKMSRFTHRCRQKIAINLSRSTDKFWE